jgi:hypothetical protein
VTVILAVRRPRRLGRAAARVAGHHIAQDGEDVLAVLAGGVDAAADIEPGLGGVVAGELAGDLLLGPQGPDAALADAAGGPDRGVAAEAEHVILPTAAELQQVAARALGGGVLRPGDAGDLR